MEVWYMTACAMTEAGFDQIAADAWTKAVMLGKTEPDCLHKLAVARWRSGERDNAMKTLLKVSA